MNEPLSVAHTQKKQVKKGRKRAYKTTAKLIIYKGFVLRNRHQNVIFNNNEMKALQCLRFLQSFQ